MGANMDYTMEELIPVVTKLTEKYTGNDSTSVTYETANQLMAAVLYCLREEAGSREGGTGLTAAGEREDLWQTYQAGYVKVLDKTARAKRLYEAIIRDFNSYGNQCCDETVIRGMPEFFVKYDARFRPQDELLTLDYPVLKPLGNLRGVNRVYRYLSFIWLEQRFLKSFPEEYVRRVLTESYIGWGGYEEMIFNLCSVMMRNTAGHMMIGKKLSDYGFSEWELERIEQKVREKTPHEAETELQKILLQMVGADPGEGKKVFDYLSGDLKNFAHDLKNAAENGGLKSIFIL